MGWNYNVVMYVRLGKNRKGENQPPMRSITVLGSSVKVVRREEENREACGLIQEKGLWRDFFF